MMRNKTLILGITAGFAFLLTGCGDSPESSALNSKTNSNPNSKEAESKPRANTERRKKAASGYMVRVVVNDDTETNPLHPKAEVWFRGSGSWFIKDPTKFGSAAKELAEREPNKKDTIHLYPEGRGGQEIVVELMMTAEMNPKGNSRDSLSIDIADDEITIFGLPLKAATGEIEMKFKR